MKKYELRNLFKRALSRIRYLESMPSDASRVLREDLEHAIEVLADHGPEDCGPGCTVHVQGPVSS